MKERVNKKTNYRQACIRDGKKYHYIYIHRLVADAFVKGNGKVVNHKDCNKGNNYFENLEWCNHLHNSRHAAENGLFTRGESHHATFLTKEEVLDIKKLANKKTLTQQEIADKFNIKKSLVCAINRGKTWAWLKLEDYNENE